MQQLTGLDASFLYLETANAPMHISGLAIYDQSSAPGGKVRFKDIIENTVTRISGLPSLTRQLATVPLNLDHPGGYRMATSTPSSISATSPCPVRVTGASSASRFRACTPGHWIAAGPCGNFT